MFDSVLFIKVFYLVTHLKMYTRKHLFHHVYNISRYQYTRISLFSPVIVIFVETMRSTTYKSRLYVPIHVTKIQITVGPTEDPVTGRSGEWGLGRA